MAESIEQVFGTEAFLSFGFIVFKKLDIS